MNSSFSAASSHSVRSVKLAFVAVREPDLWRTNNPTAERILSNCMFSKPGFCSGIGIKKKSRSQSLDAESPSIGIARCVIRGTRR